jgi:hypothetical protein
MFFYVYDDARLDPGRAFRLVVKVNQFVLETEYGEYGGQWTLQSSNMRCGLI